MIFAKQTFLQDYSFEFVLPIHEKPY